VEAGGLWLEEERIAIRHCRKLAVIFRHTAIN